MSHEQTLGQKLVQQVNAYSNYLGMIVCKIYFLSAILSSLAFFMTLELHAVRTVSSYLTTLSKALYMVFDMW